MVWADGARYEGEWKNGKVNGQGIKITADGTRFEGEYINDSPHGSIIKTFPDGSQIEEFYQYGELITETTQ